MRRWKGRREMGQWRREREGEGGVTDFVSDGEDGENEGDEEEEEREKEKEGEETSVLFSTEPLFLRRVRKWRSRKPKVRAPLLRVLINPAWQWVIDFALDLVQYGALAIWIAGWIPTLWNVFSVGAIVFNWGMLALSLTGNTLTLIYMVSTRQWVWAAGSILSILCYLMIVSVKIYEFAF